MTSPAAIVDELLIEFVRVLRLRDVEGALRLFADDAALFGSEAGEQAVGRAALREFFGALFARTHTYGWTWDPPTTGEVGRGLWFVAAATAELQDGTAVSASLPYRLSGVLQEAAPGIWQFSLFNGSEPAPPQI